MELFPIYAFFGIGLCYITGSIIFYYNRKKRIANVFQNFAKKYKFIYIKDFNHKLNGLIKDNKVSIHTYRSNYEYMINIKIEYNFSGNIYFYFNKRDINNNFCILNNVNYKENSTKIFSSASIADNTIAYLDFYLCKKILTLNAISADFNISDKAISITCPFSNNSNIIEDKINQIIDIIEDLNKNISLKERFLNSIKNERYIIYLSNLIRQYIKNFKIDNDIYIILKNLLNNKNIDLNILAASYLKEEGLEYLLSLFDKNIKITEINYLDIIYLFKSNLFIKSCDKLKELYLKTKSKNLKIEILKTFKEFKNENLNDFLLSIPDEGNIDIKTNIIEALGTCGKLNAVEKLYILNKASFNPMIKNAIQNSIGLIQLRSGSGEKGYLSTVEISETDGALSIPEQIQGGELSKTEN